MNWTVELFSWSYFFFILVNLGAFFGLYFLFRRRSARAKWWVVFSLLVANFLLHFLSPLYLGIGFASEYRPGMGYVNRGVDRIFLNNICAVSAVLFPFLFLSKDRFWRSGMVFVGVLSGILAMLLPTEALGNQVSTWQQHVNLWRFYIQHAIIWIAPMLMLAFGMHRLRWRDVWISPVYMVLVFCLIVTNSAIRQVLGSTGNMLNSNNSMQWRPDEGLRVLFNWLIPDFMTRVPLGPNAGAYAYWPILYLVPAIFFYLTIFAALTVGGQKLGTRLNKRRIARGGGP